MTTATADKTRPTSAHHTSRSNGHDDRDSTAAPNFPRTLASPRNSMSLLSSPTPTASAEMRPPTPFKCNANGKGWLNALHMAAQRGQEAVLQTLLQQGMGINDQDSDGLTPLMHAVANGHHEAVSLLLQHGAQITAQDRLRRSALHWAVKARREAILGQLLRHADHANDLFLIDAYDDSGHAPLHAAINSGFGAGVAVLLEYGANVHARAKKP